MAGSVHMTQVSVYSRGERAFKKAGANFYTGYDVVRAEKAHHDVTISDA